MSLSVILSTPRVLSGVPSDIVPLFTEDTLYTCIPAVAVVISVFLGNAVGASVDAKYIDISPAEVAVGILHTKNFSPSLIFVSADISASLPRRTGILVQLIALWLAPS